MRKSSSCPNFFGNTIPKQNIPKVPSGTTLNALPLHVEVDLTAISRIEHQLEYQLQYQAIFKTPAYTAGICTLENGTFDVQDEEQIKTLGACLATPCDIDEPRSTSDIFQKRHLLVMNDQNRAGELVSRIRRKKKSTSSQEV